jgi:hypothetical protein
MLVFSTQLCEMLPLYPSPWFNSHPHPPLSCVKVQYCICTDSVWKGKGVGLLSPDGDHILQKFNTLYLTKFRTYKIVIYHPKQNLGGVDR